MKRSIYAVACLMMVLLAGFTACGDDDDSNVAYFEKNRDYIREKKALKGDNGELLYKQVVLGGDTALYRVLSKEGEETQCPTAQTSVTMTLKGDFISGQNFQKEMTMTLTPAILSANVSRRLSLLIWDMVILIIGVFPAVQP